MHELSIVAALLERANAEAKRRNALRITSLSVRIGELSGVVPEALEYGFECLREDTPCAEATLELTVVPARWVCGGCERQLSDRLTCDGCGGTATLQQGDEILLENMELEVSDV